MTHPDQTPADHRAPRPSTPDERPWALVTGATGGLGQAFAGYLARRDHNLVLVGRRTEVLDRLADRIRVDHGVQVITESVDLSDPARTTALTTDLADRGICVDTLVNNAGFGTLTTVAEADPARLAAEVAVDCQAVVQLSSTLLPAMIARGRGTIINVSSTAAFQPIPGFATYAAAKAFVLSFSRALWSETRGTGVRVTAICPGPTDTGFFDAAGDDGFPGRRRHPDQVVETAFRALSRHEPAAVDGLANKVQTTAVGLVPARLATAAAGRLFD
ncbi:NAD(P)-dependent oxidoreductase [Acidipropionibacterium jensenii]|uniref:NAD(P)-dependent oxidoreductase n=1 Tax=Acidipropionibacterium jensenii TaxID=1749 RepID=A0A3T0RXK9_9ACTN|nr:NAD(P)-dependent oxidoreductase [Acidipropionibacterium jensenii]QCV88116.1 SDR family oxidoreductase [Acidipropionibacterium jensenii]